MPTLNENTPGKYRANGTAASPPIEFTGEESLDEDEIGFAEEFELTKEEGLKTMGSKAAAFIRQHPKSFAVGAATVGAGVLVASGVWAGIGVKAKSLGKKLMKNDMLGNMTKHASQSTPIKNKKKSKKKKKYKA